MYLNDYPTDEQLQFIRDYDPKLGPAGLIKHLQEIWHWPDRIRLEPGIDDLTCLFLSTGGWSGNEDIIEVLESTIFWLMFWQKSERGGHYYFEIPDMK